MKNNPVRKLYDWVLSWAEKPSAMYALFLLGFAESSFFPVPPDVLLIPLVLGFRKKWFKLALILTIGSAAGGAFGYLIGAKLWGFGPDNYTGIANFFYDSIPGFSQNAFETMKDKYDLYGFWVVFTAGFTPIPYKIFTISSGAFNINFLTFIIASFVSRGARFFLVSFLIYKFGEPIKKFINKYFNILAIVFTILLVGGFVLIKGLTTGHDVDKEAALHNPVRVVDKNGVTRNYKLYLPVKSDEDIPLLVYFHGVRSEGFRDKHVLKGYTGSPLIETGLIPFCRVNNIALLEILPSYTYRFMDLDAHGWSPFEKEIDGIEKCIDTISGKYNIDNRKIFLAGISAGAVMSNHLANRRPGKYKAIISHSQAYISEDNKVLIPDGKGKKFGVVFCYTKGDYKNLKDICERSYKIYKENGYNTVLLRDLPPLSHKWSNSTNGRFWRSLLMTGGNSR